MMLTDPETAALRNLADKKTGALTTFINIADARRLTKLGLAQRSRQGWDITQEGSAYLASLEPEEGYLPLKLAQEPSSVRETLPQNDQAGSDSQEGGGCTD